MNASQEIVNDGIGQIAAALAQAQAVMKNPAFDAQNPHFKNRFASLAAVRNAIIPALSKYGICLTQDLKTAEGSVSCTTILSHESGQQMSFGPYTLPVVKADAQGYGSASTYARRYHMMAVAGVVGDSDDDAEAAVGRSDEPQTRQDFTRADHNRAQEYADRFRKALTEGKEDLIYELHNELNPEAMFYVLVSTKLSAAERSSLKESIKHVHESRKPNGRQTSTTVAG